MILTLSFLQHFLLIFSRALAAYTDALYNWGLLEQRASVRKHGQSLRDEASRAAVSFQIRGSIARIPFERWLVVGEHQLPHLRNPPLQSLLPSMQVNFKQLKLNQISGILHVFA